MTIALLAKAGLPFVPHLGVVDVLLALLTSAWSGNGAAMVRKPRKARSMRRISEASLRARFMLTPAEVQIALGIAEGKTLASIAKMRGVAVSTARGQLKSVFVKTGTHRQAELVALLVGPRRHIHRRDH